MDDNEKWVWLFRVGIGLIIAAVIFFLISAIVYVDDEFTTVITIMAIISIFVALYVIFKEN